MDNTPDILKIVMAQRIAAGFSILIKFNDGRPDFTGHYRTIDERDAKMTAALRMKNFASAEIVSA